VLISNVKAIPCDDGAEDPPTTIVDPRTCRHGGDRCARRSNPATAVAKMSCKWSATSIMSRVPQFRTCLWPCVDRWAAHCSEQPHAGSDPGAWPRPSDLRIG